MKRVLQSTQQKAFRWFRASRSFRWYCVIAVFNAALFVGLNMLFLQLSLKPSQASALALVPVLAVSYLGHKTKTFRSAGRHRDELPRFIVMCVIDLILAAVIPSLAAQAHIPHIWVSIAVSGLIPLANVVIMRFWIFSFDRDADQSSSSM